MRFRNLVPALACLAAIPTAFAAETTAVKVDGFVDTFLSSSSVINSEPETSSSDTSFSFDAKLGVSATISEKVAAKVDLFIDGKETGVAGSNKLNVRQAYGTWLIDPAKTMTLKTGKFISDYGWVAPYAPDLIRINTGPITGLYGVDQIGANFSYSKDALTAALTVANGFFGEGTEEVAQSASNQGNESFAYGLDVGYKVNDQLAVDAELVFDTDAGSVPGFAGGDGIHFGLNGTFTPTKELKVGAEFIYQTIGAPDDTTLETVKKMGFLGAANFKLNDTMSVTGMVQYVGVNNVAGVEDDETSVVELAAALLTTPAGTDKLGVNFELSYTKADATTAGVDSDSSSIGASVEILYVLP
jgi:hypothetical protein